MRFSHRAQFHQSEFHDCNLGNKENSVGRAMCITSTLFYTRFAGAFRTKQDVFKSSSRDFIAMTCIGKKKVTLKEEA